MTILGHTLIFSVLAYTTLYVFDTTVITVIFTWFNWCAVLVIYSPFFSLYSDCLYLTKDWYNVNGVLGVYAPMFIELGTWILDRGHSVLCAVLPYICYWSFDLDTIFFGSWDNPRLDSLPPITGTCDETPSVDDDDDEWSDIACIFKIIEMSGGLKSLNEPEAEQAARDLLSFDVSDAFDWDDLPIDYSNILEHRGQRIDVGKLTTNEAGCLMMELDTAGAEKLTNLECMRSLQHYSTPTVKLYYPEPFIASPSFVQNDIFFLHVLQYQYWLWFIFIFLICFFFITFLCVVRWCNQRTQPRKETRGVSRSKCGDLITACVPVSWATSIIISESTDAVDYFDGFGTGEIIVGVRAYQWGWEYYYPRDLDLNYNVKPSYSSFIGNSLKYTPSPEKTLSSNAIWRFYQNNKSSEIITPAHLLLTPADNSKMFTFLDFDEIGTSTLKPSTAFKKIRRFSKVYNTNLVHANDSLTAKYNKINELYVTENMFTDSMVYGTTRQHNLTARTATTNNNASLMDQRSMNKFLSYTMGMDNKDQSTNVFSEHMHRFSQPMRTAHNLNSVSTAGILTNNNPSYNAATLGGLLVYPQLITRIDGYSSKTATCYPIRKLFTEIGNEVQFNNKMADKWSPAGEDNSPSADPVLAFARNKNRQSKEFYLNAIDDMVLTNEQSPRLTDIDKIEASYLNLSDEVNCIAVNSKQYFKRSNVATVEYWQNQRKSSWANLNLINHAAANRLFMSNGHPAVVSNNVYRRGLDFDANRRSFISPSVNDNKLTMSVKTSKKDEVAILQGPRENVSPALAAAYWQMFWANSNPDHRIKHAILSSVENTNFYLPDFTDYYDYDFRNESALELLEDAFWETAYSGYNHDDYLSIESDSKQVPYIEHKAIRRPFYFYPDSYQWSPATMPLTAPFLKDLSTVGKFYANAVQADDYISPAGLVTNESFNVFPTLNFLFDMEDSYEEAKGLNNCNTSFNNNVLNIPTNYNPYQSYIQVLNAFRQDFDEFSLSSDEVFEQPSEEPLDLFGVTEEFLTNYDIFDDGALMGEKHRFSSQLALRKPARNSIVTYNAMQKVFRSRFDEGRSLVNLGQFADSDSKQSFLTGGRLGFEKMLGKNKESFYATTLFKKTNLNILNDLYDLTSSMNFYFYELPFFISNNSDPARYYWFDRYAQWGIAEVQPSSMSKYSTLGVPFTKKHYDFTIDEGESLGGLETYYSRVARHRKNYLPVWLYTPYLYTRANVWNNNFTDFSRIFNEYKNTRATVRLLDEMVWYEDHLSCVKNTSEHFTPSFSVDKTAGRSSWRPYGSVAAYSYNMGNLADILTKREYVYRQYFESTQKAFQLPKVFTASPKHPLFTELKAAFNFVDPINYMSEYSRNTYYSSLAFFKYILFKDILISTQTTLGQIPLNTSLVNEYLLFYFFDTGSSNKSGKSKELYKSQFRPLKKGINNMLRLQASGAVAMPIEIRLQILASSKDVIHSWAIPSAGIKIDCIPGYTSHRIMIFLISGIYWGQCQEICGRYHHWMPIIVYFMKRDLFFLWCTHFVFNTDGNGTLNMGDRPYADYVRFASYDKSTWLSEVGQYL